MTKPKTDQPHKHQWMKTERIRAGVLFKLHACPQCKELRAYDMVRLSDRKAT